MIIVSQNEEKIVNLDKVIDIEIVREYGCDKDINRIRYVDIVARTENKSCFLGRYKNEKDAKTVLKLIAEQYELCNEESINNYGYVKNRVFYISNVILEE